MVVQQIFNEILAAEDNSDKVQHLVKMEEINFIIRKCIAENMMNYLQTLLKSKEYSKWYHWWFAIFLTPNIALTCIMSKICIDKIR